MDLPALRTITFLHGNGLVRRGRVRVGTRGPYGQRAGLRPSWLVYGQLAGLRPARVDLSVLMLTRDRYQDADY